MKSWDDVKKSPNAVLAGVDLSSAAPAGIWWRRADDPPSSIPDKWSREVVAITNFGDVFCLACMDGHWQRPARFNNGEQVAFWIDKPVLP